MGDLKIYYIWFGNRKKNKLQKKCISSWKKYLSEYDIVEINETNFDINCNKFCQEAYKAHKFNYLSDFVRLKIIYENGGIYFDTDVELINRPNFLKNTKNWFSISLSCGVENICVNTGSGFCCEKGHPLLEFLMSDYLSWDKDSMVDNKNFPNIEVNTKLNLKHFLYWGFKSRNQLQIIKNVTFFPSDYFDPLDYLTRNVNLSINTCGIHYYECSSDYYIDHWFTRYCAKENKKSGHVLEYYEIRKKMMLKAPLHYLVYHLKHRTKYE